ncbi:MAG TPA: acyl carrier protein [Rhizomicrobium sp.]|jgi:acyl carrier protein
MDTLEQITPVFRDLFDEYDGPIHRGLVAKDVAQWDSLANIQLAVMIEQATGVRFASDEFRKCANLGEVVDTIDRKKSAKA